MTYGPIKDAAVGLATMRAHGGPAFPQSFLIEGEQQVFPGISARDYFAAKVLQALAGNTDYMTVIQAATCGDGDAQRVLAATNAYQYADAMLAARAKEAR